MVQGWLSVVAIILVSTSLASFSGGARETASSPLRSDVSLRPDSQVGRLEDEAGPAALVAMADPAMTGHVNEVATASTPKRKTLVGPGLRRPAVTTDSRTSPSPRPVDAVGAHAPSAAPSASALSGSARHHEHRGHSRQETRPERHGLPPAAVVGQEQQKQSSKRRKH